MKTTLLVRWTETFEAHIEAEAREGPDLIDALIRVTSSVYYPAARVPGSVAIEAVSAGSARAVNTPEGRRAEAALQVREGREMLAELGDAEHEPTSEDTTMSIHIIKGLRIARPDSSQRGRIWVLQRFEGGSTPYRVMAEERTLIEAMDRVEGDPDRARIVFDPIFEFAWRFDGGAWSVYSALNVPGGEATAGDDLDQTRKDNDK